MKLRIKENCQRSGITQKDLAAAVGVSEVTLSRAANGNTSLQLLESISNALGVSISELFEVPKTGAAVCPHCGKELKIRIE